MCNKILSRYGKEVYPLVNFDFIMAQERFNRRPVLLQCRSDVTKTYNLEAYDNWFNCLSMLVATEICRVGIHRKQGSKGILALRTRGRQWSKWDLNISSAIKDNSIIQALNYLHAHMIKSSRLCLTSHIFSNFVQLH